MAPKVPKDLSVYRRHHGLPVPMECETLAPRCNGCKRLNNFEGGKVLPEWLPSLKLLSSPLLHRHDPTSFIRDALTDAVVHVVHRVLKKLQRVEHLQLRTKGASEGSR